MGGAGEFVVAMTSDSSFGSDTSSKSIQAEHFANDLPPCPSTPAPGCIPAERAVVKWNEQAVGREKVKLALRKLVGAVTQGQFGDPVAGTTRYDLCLYDEAGELAGGLSVDRAGDTCAGNPCWAALSTRGYRYKDDPREEGLSKLVAKGGDAGKGKVVARGNNRLGEVSAVPIQVAQALAGASSATVQLVTSDGGCFEAELGTVKRAEQFSFVAKGP
jgi:hypothetical protein